MTSTAPAAGRAASEASHVTPRAVPRAARELRLDVARGLALLIIFVAHVPDNAWNRWIPARWGFSDATEIFVFCSGMASAIVFGGTFARAGWALGTARVAFRVWQIYWAHIGLFLALFVLLAFVDASGMNPGRHYVGSLNLWKILDEPAQALLGIATLRWVPNYLDILPMYLVILAMVPIAVALARISPRLALAVSALVWVLAQGSIMGALGLGAYQLRLPAEPWSDRTWFFNPFGWQLIFFCGFAFLRGWLPKPPVTPVLVWSAVAVLVAGLALSTVGLRIWEIDIVKAAYISFTGCVESGFGACNPVFDWRQSHALWWDKTDLSMLHIVHFLALAYLAFVVAGPDGARLRPSGTGRWDRVRDTAVEVTVVVGRQSLAVFVFAMALSQVAGLVLDLAGRGSGTVALVNLGGLALIVLCALVVGWFRSQPWRAAR